MKNINYSLTDLGYSAKEAKVYSALLELGEGTVHDISRQSRLNRTTVYPLIYKLLRDGVIKKIIKTKKRYYFVEDVRDLKKSFSEKEKILQAMLPELQAIHNIIPHKPRITLYEGEGGMRDFYFHILDSLQPGETIEEYIGNMHMEDKASLEWAKSLYPHERMRRKIKIKIIATPSAIAENWKKSAPQSLREIRIVPQPLMGFSANAQIYKNGIGFISYHDGFMGVIIESKDISNMFHGAFELMWQAAGTLKR